MRNYNDIAEIIGMEGINDEEIDAFCVEHFFRLLTRNGKPSWDTYFLHMARLVSTRSIDPNTKHGCVIVDDKNRVLSLGYNGPIQGIDDSKVPLTRPEKYSYMIHAEANAVLFCKADTKGATAYITGQPCATCTRMLIQKGVARIICGQLPSNCIDEIDGKASTEMLQAANVSLEFRELNGSIYTNRKNNSTDA